MITTKLLIPAAALFMSASAFAHGAQSDHAHDTEFDTVTEPELTDGRPTTPGSHMMLQAAIEAADGLEVIISDVIIPPNASVPLHEHPGEEFLYVIEGSALHRQEGMDDIWLSAGDAFVITPYAAHSPIGGPDGARAIVFRVHVEGQPERILIDAETGEPLED